MAVGRVGRVAGSFEIALGNEPEAAPGAGVADDAVDRPRPPLTLTGAGPNNPLGLPRPLSQPLSPDLQAARIRAAIQEARTNLSAPRAAAAEGTPADPTTRFDALAQRIAALRQATNELNADNTPFSLKSITDITLPALEQMLAELRASPNQPEAAMLERIIDTIVSQSTRLVEVWSEAKAVLPNEVLAARQALQASGIPTGWSATELNNIVGAANQLAEYSARKPIGFEIEQLAYFISEHRARLRLAVQLDADRRVAIPQSISAAEALVQTARADVAGRLGVPPSSVLNTSPTPEELLAGARQQLEAIRTNLGTGNIDGALQARNAARVVVQQVSDLGATARGAYP